MKIARLTFENTITEVLVEDIPRVHHAQGRSLYLPCPQHRREAKTAATLLGSVTSIWIQNIDLNRAPTDFCNRRASFLLGPPALPGPMWKLES